MGELGMIQMPINLIHADTSSFASENTKPECPKCVVFPIDAVS
jgi:hypothetical protein